MKIKERLVSEYDKDGHLLIVKDAVTSVVSTQDADLKESVLAENVEIVQVPGSFSPPGYLAVTFDFLCPNCGKRHWATEYDGGHLLFSTVAWRLKCGWVGVRMPWAATPQRDKRSIYQQKKQPCRA